MSGVIDFKQEKEKRDQTKKYSCEYCTKKGLPCPDWAQAGWDDEEFAKLSIPEKEAWLRHVYDLPERA